MIFQRHERAQPFAMYIITALLFLSALPMWATDIAQTTFEKANQSYEQGQYAPAVEEYQKAISEGLANPTLYYNYANALFREKHLGLSILYYEKAARLAPSDADIQANLKFAEGQIVDKHPAPEQNLLTRVLFKLHNSYSLNAGLFFLLITFSLGFVFLTIRLILTNTAIKMSCIGLAIISWLLCLIALPTVSKRVSEATSAQSAIVLAEKLSIYSGPGSSYQLLSQVHEGTKFLIEEESGTWAKVKLLSGQGGWVEVKSLGKI